MKEYIIKIGDEPDIMGNYPLKEEAKELVRCKNCKHSGIDSTSYPHYWCSALSVYREADEFCSDGERKT